MYVKIFNRDHMEFRAFLVVLTWASSAMWRKLLRTLKDEEYHLLRCDAVYSCRRLATFGVSYCLILQNGRVSKENKQQRVLFLVLAGFWRWRQCVSSKHLWMPVGLHVVTSQNSVLYIVTAVRISNQATVAYRLVAGQQPQNTTAVTI
jgi:hypothetical protein